MYGHLKHLTIRLSLLILLFSFVKGYAQTCDENIQKALEQTRATTFTKVTLGAEAYFYIRYPLAGTTYSLLDQEGNSYSLRYIVPSGGTEQVFLTIPIGRVRQKRSFSLKAQNGSCSYETGFIYTIEPQTTPQLSLRIEPEWCNDSGAIYYQLVGTSINPADYKVYYKKTSDKNYDFNANRLVDASLGVRTLAAGTYDLIAKHNTDETKSIEQKGIFVRNEIQKIQFTPTFIPTPCQGNGNIKVEVKSGRYPLYFTLYDNERKTVIRPKQTSNVFTNVPKGSYEVLVENFCAVGGGAQTFGSVKVDDYTFEITDLNNGFTLREHTCEYLQFSGVRMTSKNAYTTWYNNTVPYPFTIEFFLTSPSNKVYPYSYTITNRDEFQRFFEISNDYIQIREVYQNIPIEHGTWTLSGRAIVCGKTTNFRPVKKEVLNSIEYYDSSVGPYGNTCSGAQIFTLRKSDNANLTIPVYYVLEKYPSHFDPNVAGFYKINTSHPSLANKYVKKILGISSQQLLVAGDYLRAGDEFQFRVVSEDCHKETLLTPLKVGTSSRRGSISNTQVGSCKADKNGSKFSSWVMNSSNLEINNLKIIAFDGDATQFPAGFSIPYTVGDQDRVGTGGQFWIIRDLPIGKYTYAYTDVCGNTQTATYQIKEETYSVTFEDGCIPKIKGVKNGDYKRWTSFSIQRFDEENNRWGTVSFSGGLLGQNGTTIATVTGEKQGKFRVVRSVNTRPEITGNAYDCAIVLAEKEFRGSLRKPEAVGFGCSNSKYHVALIPQGGTPPYTYTLVSKKVPGQQEVILNQHSDNENFFLNVDATDLNTYYVFKVTDACGQGDTVDGVIANFKAPVITPDKTVYCNGQSAVLMLPDLGSKIKIQWFKNDSSTPIGEGTTLSIPSVANGDKYSVKLVTSYETAIESCLSLAVQPYTFNTAAGATSLLPIQGKDQNLCVSTYTDFDLNSLFNDPNPTQAGIVKRIVDKNNVIVVPESGKTNVNTSDFLRKNTFVYRLENICGEVIQQAEATLEVKRAYFFDQYVHKNITICQASTYNDIKQLIIAKSKSDLRTNAPTFVWYPTLQDAQSETNPLSDTASIGTIPADGEKTLYLRLAKKDYCPSKVIEITVHQLNTNAPATKTFTNACALNAGELKKLIDSKNFADINIYQGGAALNDNFQFQNATGITYTQKVGECETQPAPIILDLRPITQASPQALKMCVSYSDSRYPVVTVDEVKVALRLVYPNAAPNGIKLYNYYNNEYAKGTDEIQLSYQYATFSVEETGKCPSARYPVFFVEKEKTPAAVQEVSLCENSTIADLKPHISGSQLKIYKRGVLQTDNNPIDWTLATIGYQYTIEENGKCPSYKTQIILRKATDNLTPITPRGVSICGVTATMSAVKAAIGNNARIYAKNNNGTYYEVSNNASFSIGLNYYYTIQEAGKCVSEKAPLAISTTPNPPKNVKTIQTTCGANPTVAQLEPQGVGVYWYREATGGVALSPNERLTKGVYYVANAAGACESSRVRVQVYPSLEIQSVTPNYTTVQKGANTIVTYNIIGTPKAIVSYRFAGNTTETITLSDNGTFGISKRVSQTTTFQITQIANGNCTLTTQHTVTVTAVEHCATPPNPQFAPTDNAVATMNGVEVKRSFTGTPLFNPTYGAFCQPAYNANYAWLRSDQNSKLTYTFSRPVKSATVFLLLMGNTPTGLDRAKITTNCGATQYAKVVYDCRGVASFSNGVVNSSNGVVNDVAIKVTSNNGAFTELVIEDLAVANGYGFFVEICPTSIEEANVFNITESPQSQEVCKGGNVTFTSKAVLFSPYTNGANINYQWQQSADGGTTFTNITGATGVAVGGVASMTLTNVVATLHNNLYRVVYTYTNTLLLCNTVVTKTSTTATLTLNNSIVVTQQPASATYCKDEIAIPLSVVATGTNLHYQWYQNTVNGTVGATLIEGETTASYTPSTAKGEVKYYFVKVVSDNCTEESAIAKVEVKAAPVISAAPISATYCQNTASTPLRVNATGEGTLQYQWYQNSQNNNEGGTLLSGQTNATYTPPTSAVGTTYYYATVRNNCGVATSTTAKVTIDAPVAIVTQPANVLLCQNEPTTNAMRVVATGKNLRYQWYDNGSNNSNAGGTALTGEIYDTFVPPVHSVGIKYYYATVADDCGGVLTSTAARAEVQTPTAITSHPVSAEYCYGVTPTPLKVEATGIGTLKYQWYYINKNNSKETIMTGQTGSTYTPLTSYVHTDSYFVVVTSDCGIATSTIAKIEVKANAGFTKYPQRATYCKGAQAVPLIIQATGEAPITYQWYSNTINSTNGATAIAGATGTTYTPSTADAGVRYYFVSIANACRTVTSSVVDVRVQEVQLPIVPQTSYTLCGGSSQTIATLRPQGANYVWYNSATSTMPLANSTPLTAGTYYVAQKNGTCESARVAVSVVYSNTLSVAVPNHLTIACNDANINTTVSQWLAQATVTDTCGTATLTHDYTVVKPADWCNASVVTVTFVGKDPMGNTVTKTSTIKVLTIDAVDDTHTTPVNGTNGATDVIDVLQNDTIGGAQATTANVQISVVTPATGGTVLPTLNIATGKIDVPVGTKSGTYNIQYKICHIENSVTVCDTATATVKVGSTPIVATNDTYTITTGSSATSTTGTVLDNDKLGTKTPTTTDVILTVATTTTDVIGATQTPSIDSNGKVQIPAGTKSGTYQIVYNICERLNPDNCATATATVKVGSTPIVATNDTYTITTGSSATSTTGTVLDNDKLGTKTPTTTDVILTVATTTTDVIGATQTPTIDSNGKVQIPAGTKSGTYQIVYNICERLNPDNCATATATVKVGSTPIVATNDTYTITTGSSATSTTGTVLDNDKLGTKTPTTTDVILTVVTTTTDVVGATQTPTIDSNGKVQIPAGTKSGTYQIVYNICERLNPDNCATATATVKVGSTPIVATNDTYTITTGSSATTTTGTVLDNDKLGTKTPTTTDVILTVVTTTTDVVGATQTPTIDSNGKVQIPAGTKSGTYQIVYNICERLNPDNCATATATVKVGSTPIVATNDTYTITTGSSATSTTGTVLDNDKLGTKTPTTTDVILTVVTTTTDVIGATQTPSIDSNGKVQVPAGTKSGTYQIVYNICERLNPDNCATATATVKVFVPALATPTTIEANDDGVVTFTQGVGGTTTSVLTNDKLNGVLNPSTSSVTLTWNTATPTDFTLNPDGTITVAPHTAVATHTISYTICAVASPTVCSSAVITVVISATTTTPTVPVLPIAVDDRATTALNTPVIVNVLANDTPNGATTPNVVTSPANGVVIVNADGSVEYRPNTGFEGVDSFVYELCNTDGCATATVTIDVVNKLVPYNAISVDGDGKNDHFHIGGIERYPNNVVRIYNRWGVKVFETDGYDNVTRVFRGISNGRITVEQADKLPQGTYYYVIEYYDSNNQKESLVGWLYLKK